MTKDQATTYQEKNGDERNFRRCTAYCTATSFAYERLLSSLREQGIRSTQFPAGGVVHRVFGADEGSVFYFSYGTIVMWGLSQEEERNVLHHIKSFENEPVESTDYEEYRYFMGTSAKIVRNDISLPSDDIITKLAISHGLAQSVKLGTFEKRIEFSIAKTKYIPERLAMRGKIPLSRLAISKLMGNLFIDRALVNLHTNILDTPEFFWEHSDFEPLYRLIAQDLDMAARVNVLNRRMDILKDLFEMLGNELDSRHSSRLELTIIGLIMAELLIVVVKELLNLS